MAYVSIQLGEGQVAYVRKCLAARIQKIDFDLGDCHNEIARADLLVERTALVTALGEIAAAEL